MAFSEEQEAQILGMIDKMGEFLSKQSEKQEEKKEPEKKDEGLLSEAKKNMEKQNIVRLRRGKITILNQKELTRLR